MLKWTIRREQGRNFDPITDVFTGYNHHKVWVLRINGRRAATYRKWSDCIDHISMYYLKFGGK